MVNPFVFACIAPHGLPIIEELSKPDLKLMSKTRSSMIQLGTWMREANPDTIIVLTPHGMRIDSQFCVVNASFMSGQMSEKTVAAFWSGIGRCRTHFRKTCWSHRQLRLGACTR